MPTLTIDDVPEDVLQSVKEQAKRNHRSLQRELLAILEAAADQPPRMTAAQALAEIRRLNLPPGPRSVDIIPADRDRDQRRRR